MIKIKRFLLLSSPDCIPNTEAAGKHTFDKFPGVTAHHWPFSSGFCIVEVEGEAKVPEEWGKDYEVVDVTDEPSSDPSFILALKPKEAEEAARQLGNKFFSC